MKKRIIFILTFIVMIFTLSSCTLFQRTGDTDYGIDKDKPVVEITTSYTEAYYKVNSACVGIRNVVSSTNYKIGSGVVIKTNSNDTYVLTNRHVVEAENEKNISTGISVYFGNGFYVKGTVVAANSYDSRKSSSKNDLALIKINTPSSKTITAVDLTETADVVSKGQTVMAIGCPTSLDLFNTLTVGVVEKVLTNGLIQHQAAINPGNSGGGLFNLEGRLIGINVMRTEATSSGEYVESIGYAIALDSVRSFLSTNNFEF